MKFNKYSLLLISFLTFISIGTFLYFKYLNAEEFSKLDGGLQPSYDALNLEIINIIYIPTVMIIHILLFIVFKFKDKKQSIVK
ncbi:hypothetical protein KHA94_09680 [Bacillus sp. FJAT-49705]|uniref:Uncharacterized protein n=1 Tax=Cytobacillus citreus TaxID=2833586 RepID=A0ABS5NU95_9BACI|nr:hypothetical protein [Cytobacillus citreus]MBS4190459.1 hypothetical protein [Cytobacillus citreus]